MELEIIKAPEFQRLKKITLSGLSFLFKDATVFEHSIGVYEILSKVGASFEEKVMGLLHDISRPAFGHIIDFAFEDYEKQEYHEKIIDKFLENSNIKKILEKHGLNLEKMIKKFRRKEYKLLDSSIPEICADRIDYSLRHFKIILKRDVHWVLDFIKRNEVLEFTNKDAALRYSLEFLNLSEIYLTKHTPIFFAFGKIIRKALDDKAIILDDLFSKGEKEIFEVLSKRYNVHKEISKVKVTFGEDYDFLIRVKVRYVDPLVNGKRLSKIDEEFKGKLEEFLERYKNGIALKILKK